MIITGFKQTNCIHTRNGGYLKWLKTITILIFKNLYFVNRLFMSASDTVQLAKPFGKVYSESANKELC